MYSQYPQYSQFDFYPYYPPMPMFYQKPSLLQSMKYSLRQMNLSSTIQTAQKTLYTANQLIPIIHQLRPVLHNAKTAFRVVKAVKSFDLDDIDKDIDQNVHVEEPQTFEHMYPERKPS